MERGLRNRGELNGTRDVITFPDMPEKASIETVESGTMRGDLLAIAKPSPNNHKVNAGNFIDAIAENLRNNIG
jgi:isocitrate dehydrogenase